ncbi:hypothetical protein CTR2_R40280 [Comamonas thiooxydans]|uniref:hypothetical protein n=1 Tax=Comamonas thiooxydans TaxID=363952 RepID=UPI000B34D7AD|nr:hypothetical protein [Comamonas thiooxydans]BDR10690.1 hypothetical protein CTR2_R40280 [Comamonas thiooxydans]
MLASSVFDSVKVANLQSGDILVIKCQQVMPKRAVDALMQRMEVLLPEGVKAVVLDGGLDVEVLQPERGQQQASEVALLIESDIRDGGPVADALHRTYGLQRQGR